MGVTSYNQGNFIGLSSPLFILPQRTRKPLGTHVFGRPVYLMTPHHYWVDYLLGNTSSICLSEIEVQRTIACETIMCPRCRWTTYNQNCTRACQFILKNMHKQCPQRTNEIKNKLTDTMSTFVIQHCIIFSPWSKVLLFFHKCQNCDNTVILMAG